MIYGIGCDIVNIERVERIYLRFGSVFIKRILTEIELAQAPLAHRRLFVSYVAKRYAAKEAYAKAMGTGIGSSIGFQNIEILKDSTGKPYFSEKTLIQVRCKAHVSISDDYPLVIAYVIISWES
ncbi:Holo-(acyl-carrier-protein) synthase [Alphaproteobacteria bacterium]